MDIVRIAHGHEAHAAHAVQWLGGQAAGHAVGMPGEAGDDDVEAALFESGQDLTPLNLTPGDAKLAEAPGHLFQEHDVEAGEPAFLIPIGERKLADERRV